MDEKQVKEILAGGELLSHEQVARVSYSQGYCDGYNQGRKNLHRFVFFSMAIGAGLVWLMSLVPLRDGSPFFDTVKELGDAAKMLALCFASSAWLIEFIQSREKPESGKS